MNIAVTAPQLHGPSPHASAGPTPDRAAYDALMDVMQRRSTARRFDPAEYVSDATYRLIIEAARLAPSGANAQPWHFIVVTSSWTKHVMANLLEDAQARRLAQGQAMQPVDYSGIETAAGCIVVVTDFRLTWAFPGLMAGTELDQRYHANAERIILQSVSAATTAAHLAATALGYRTWWLSATGQDALQAELHKLLEVPEDLTITDIMLFGSVRQDAPKRWKKQVEDIISWDRFDPETFRSLAQIDAWMADVRSTGNPSALPTAQHLRNPRT
jgi:nitroreductase